jgi:type IV pilus assembly protein PilQ
MAAAVLTGCASQHASNVQNAAETKLITDIITSENADSVIVTVKGNRPLTYTANKQEFPLGVLFHFPETALDKIKTEYIPPENDTIGFIRATQIEEDGKASRLFIALKKDLPYEIEPDGPGLLISFSKSAQPASEVIPADSETTFQDAQEENPGTPLADATVAPASRLISVTATPLTNNVVINVTADGTIKNYQSFAMEGPPARIVVDMPGLRSAYQGEQRIAVNSEWVSRIRHFGHSDKVRMVLETKKSYLAKFSASPVDNGLLIYVGQIPAPVSKEDPASVVTQAQTAAPAQAHQNPAAETSAPASMESQAPAEAKAAASDQAVWLNRIDFASTETGSSEIIVGTTRPVQYEINKVADKQVHLKLLNTNLPEYRNRALITTRFQSAVDRVTPMQQPATAETVLVIDLREAVPYYVQQTDNVITVNFSASTIPPKPYEDAKPPAWKQALSEPAKMSEKALGSTQALPEQKLAEAQLSLEERLAGIAPEKRYTGEKIALDFYDTDIKNVFRIIREVSGKNFAIDKNVTGKVTLTLDRPVPWDQVLDLVLKMNQLGMTMEGDIIRIATLNTLAQEEKLKQAQLKAEQQALQQQRELEPLITEYIPCNYSNAQDEVLPHIQPILSDGRGKVSVDTRNNQLIITDTAEKILQAREIVRKIDQVTPQVIIEARIVEANSSYTRDLGFDWGQINIGPFNVGSATLDLALLASNLPPITPSGVVGATFQKLTGTPFSIIDAQLQASETEGKTNIISSPKVVTLDNKKARIKQGLEVPYLERDSSGNATVRFKNVDLLLEVSPNVTPDERIVMKIFITKNDVAEQTSAGPALSTNEAETELLVDDGDTIVIGGIVKSTISHTEKGIPGLRKVGVLGWLFKSQSKLDNKNELLIFITPRIVQLEQRQNI